MAACINPGHPWRYLHLAALIRISFTGLNMCSYSLPAGPRHFHTLPELYICCLTLVYVPVPALLYLQWGFAIV
eukprot:11075850-Ditylum_brightwellii.AAC.1